MQLANLQRHLVLSLLCGLVFYPFVALLVLSGKSNPQFDHYPWIVTIPFYWGNYVTAFVAIKQYIFNTVFVTLLSCTGVLCLSGLTAYIIARHRFPGRELLYYLVISLLMVPSGLTLVASFMLVKSLGLLNTRLALILPYIAGGQVFGIFLLRSFYASLPEELFEAARLDGASDLKCFALIGLPLSKAILGTLAIINALGNWNDLIWPLVTVTDERLKTITVGLAMFRGIYYTNWGPLFAGYVVASIPLILLFAFTSRYFVQGFMSGSLKL